MALPRLTKTQAKTARAIVNIFETGRVRGDYARVTVLPGDTGHLTYGRAQTTLGSGNLALLVRAYCEAAGALAPALARQLPALERCDPALDRDTGLHEALREAGLDPVMREVQDAFFDRVYWEPALLSAGRLDLRCALSVAVVYDGRVHGSFARIRDRVVGEVGHPRNVGERTWVRAYVEARRRWLAGHRNRLLRRTVYRMAAFGRLVAGNKWSLALPLTVCGVVVDSRSLAADETEPVVASAADPAERLLFLTEPAMEGADVRALQMALDLAGPAVTGIFDSRTDRAVRDFQAARGLVVDGRVGPATRAALGL